MEDILGQLTAYEQEAIHEVMRLVPFENLVALVGQKFDHNNGSGLVNAQGRCVLGALFPDTGLPVPWERTIQHWLHVPTDYKFRSDEEELIIAGIEALIHLNDKGSLRTPEAVAALLGLAPD